jgi:hypothetical protein
MRPIPTNREGLHSYIDAIIDFIDRYNFWNFYTIHLVDDTYFWNDIFPWQELAGKLSEQDLMKVANGHGTLPDLLNIEWPDSLHSFIREAHDLSLERTPIIVDTKTIESKKL